LRFEGCAIVSADGMLARVSGDHPPELTIAADQRFFAQKLDAADLIVHGRNSHEKQRNSPNRKRIIATRKIASLAPDPDSPNAVLWNPAGAAIEDAAARLGVQSGLVAVIGGTGIFDLFLDRYDVFWLTLARQVRLPGGVPVFTGVPQASADDILRRHGLAPAERRTLDADKDVVLIKWARAWSAMGLD
jgi:dihydrofolate reductase